MPTRRNYNGHPQQHGSHSVTGRHSSSISPVCSHSLLPRLPAPFVAHDIEHPFHPRLFLDDLDQTLPDDIQDDDTRFFIHPSHQTRRPTQHGWEKETMKHGEKKAWRTVFSNPPAGSRRPRDSRSPALRLSRSLALIIVQRSRQHALIDSSAATWCTVCMSPPPSPMESICHICDAIEKDALTGMTALSLSSISNLVGGSACGPPWLASGTAVDALSPSAEPRRRLHNRQQVGDLVQRPLHQL